MRKFILFILSIFLINSCKTTYDLTVTGEKFDALTQITAFSEPCLYPNGGDNNKDLVFSVQESDEKSYNLYMKNNVLSKATIQKTEGDNLNLSPNLCKKNDKIVFQYWARTNFDIFYINASKGKAISQITNTDENEYNPEWSPDGRYIIFEKGAPPKYYVETKGSFKRGIKQRDVTKITSNQIWIKDTKTGELKMLCEGSFPKFSPDGESIAYVKYDIAGKTILKKKRQVGTIWIASKDGSEPRQITNRDLGSAIMPNWSPNGDRLVFQLTKKNKSDADIYSIDIDGENLVQHTRNKANDFSPYWSRDNFIYFSSDRGSEEGQYQIFRFKISP